MSTKSRWVNGILTYYDGATSEMVRPLAPVVYYDDFIGAYTVVPAALSEESGMDWSKKLVGTPGQPTVVGTTGANGLVACALSATSEKQNADLYMGDRLLFNMTYGLVFECRCCTTVTPTGNGEIVWGLVSGWADGPNVPTYSCWFKQAASTAILVEMDDNVTDTDDTATGIVSATGTYRIYRIDASVASSVKFYIDGVRVASSTTFVWAASGANSNVQPYFSCYKASGTGVGTLAVDYVRIWQKRS